MDNRDRMFWFKVLGLVFRYLHFIASTLRRNEELEDLAKEVTKFFEGEEKEIADAHRV